MSNLVFVGSREIGFFSEQVASRYNLEVEYIPSIPTRPASHSAIYR